MGLEFRSNPKENDKLKIASVEFVPLSLPLAAPFYPAWFPNVTQKTADGTLIKVHTDEGITGCGWQNSFGSEVKIVGESRVFKDLVYGLDLFSVEKLDSGSFRNHLQHEYRGSLGGGSSGLGRHREDGAPANLQAAGRSSGQGNGIRDTGMIKSPREHAVDALKYRDMGFQARSR